MNMAKGHAFYQFECLSSPGSSPISRALQNKPHAAKPSGGKIHLGNPIIDHPRVAPAPAKVLLGVELKQHHPFCLRIVPEGTRARSEFRVQGLGPAT